MRLNFPVAALYLGICSGLGVAQVTTERVELRSFDGRTQSVELGHISVPANRRDSVRDPSGNSSRQFSISFYRLAAKNPGNSVPIVFLMGGPGVSATFIAKVPPYFDLFSRLSEHSPVILLDQRGTGQSTPTVDCPAGFQPPRDLFDSPRTLLKTYAAAYSGCAKYWADRGAFPDDYSVEEVADDVESLRTSLGVAKVDLLALSFGTRIGLEVIRRHPSSVRRAVLQGTVTPDGLVRLPLEMAALFRQTAADLRPQAAAKGLDADIEATYRSILQRLVRDPLSVPIKNNNKAELTVTIGPDMFAALVATRTTDTKLPALLTSVGRNDTRLIAPILQSIYTDLERGAGSMMAHSIPCSGTDSESRLNLAKAQASKSLLAEPFDNAVVTDEFCREIHSSRRSKTTPAPAVDMPVLFITGDLDDRTPVALAESALRGFPHGRSVVVHNGGHELLVEESVSKLVAGFFDGAESTPAQISLLPRTFLSVADAARPLTRPR